MKDSTQHAPLLSETSQKRLSSIGSGTRQAILLTGPPDLGKRSAALWVAERVVGPRFSSQLLEIKPNDNGNISIDAIHEIRKYSQFKSTDEQDRRVVLMNDAHSMSLEAQNSFLKLLEEPPADLFIILLAWQPNRLLPTIRSRVSAIELQRPSYAQIKDRFSDVDDAQLKKLYLMTGGSPKLIEQLVDDSDHAYYKEIDEAKKILGQDVFTRLTQVDALSKDRPAADSLLQALSQVLFSAINAMASSGKDISKLLPKLEAIIEAREGMRKNYNTKLTLTLLFIRL